MCSHVGSLFTNEEQKRLASEVFNTVATCADLVIHADLVHDITDTNCWAQHSQLCLHVLDADLCFSC